MAETKREVFIKLLKYLPVGHEIDWRGDGEEAKDLAGKYLARYDAADKPVIPQSVAYAIEWFMQNDETIGTVWRNLYEDVDDDWQEVPQLREPETWMLNHQDAFTRAWLDGYSVEAEHE